jgi:hypothetical protein
MEKSDRLEHISPELARIHAHLCGDGGLYLFKTAEKDRKNRAEIVYFNNSKMLLQSFRKDMQKVFNVKMTYSQKQNKVKIWSIRIANELLKLSNYGTRDWRIPNAIKRSARKIKIEWIKAFGQDEGHCPTDRDSIRIRSMNKKGVEDIADMVKSLKIPFSVTGPHSDASFYINIKKIKELKTFEKIKE